jgi:ribonuclease BN (tRNA processing enzyme)
MTRSDNFVALLGTKGGPAIRQGSTMPTSSLLVLNGKPIVVDCGLGVTRGLVDQGIALKDLTTIFITHLHSDHYLELGPLIHTAWTAGLKHDVTIYGPKGILAYVTYFFMSMQFDIQTRIEDEGRPDIRSLVKVHTYDEDLDVTIDGVSVSAHRNLHPPIEDTFALSFKSSQHHVVFSGDTAKLQALSDFAKGADLLIHEAMLPEGIDALVARVGNGDERLRKHLFASHSTAQEAACIAKDAGTKALALHHLIPSDDPAFTSAHWEEAVAPHYDGKLFVGKDGLRIEL